LLVNEGKNLRAPTHALQGPIPDTIPPAIQSDGERALCIMVAMQPEGDLMQPILTTGAKSTVAGLLHGRHKQPDQETDDADDNNQLDQAETGPSA
jgi:hypothetical protein